MAKLGKWGFSVAAIVALAISAGGMRGQAQEGAITDPIPNHIHAGACAALGDVVAPLTDLLLGGQGGTPEASPMASPMASPATGSGSADSGTATTTVPLALADIVGAPHSVNFHDPAAPGDATRYLACGDITGAPDATGNLTFSLLEDNDSGFSGEGQLMDNGDGTTMVTVTLGRAEGA